MYCTTIAVGKKMQQFLDSGKCIENERQQRHTIEKRIKKESLKSVEHVTYVCATHQ